MAYGGSLLMVIAYSSGSPMWSRRTEVQRASSGQCLGGCQIYRGRDSSSGKASTGQSTGRSQTGKSQIPHAIGALTNQTINIILSDAIPGYLEPSIRQSSYAAVKPTRLALVLQKLAKGTAATPGGGAMSRAERRRMEADQVARLPGA
jgi:outer membrane protein assembly factor BamB